jgi:hypothetical protein
MTHPTHAMNAYRDDNKWVAYCTKCSAETDADLEKECPGEYVRKAVDNSYTKPMKQS